MEKRTLLKKLDCEKHILNPVENGSNMKRIEKGSDVGT